MNIKMEVICPYEVILPVLDKTLLKDIISEEFGEEIFESLMNGDKESVGKEDLYKIRMWARDAFVLSDDVGQKIILRYRKNLSESERVVFDKLSSQYDRSLWLYKYHYALFHEAVRCRELAPFDERTSGLGTLFFIGENRIISEDKQDVEQFFQALSKYYLCDVIDISLRHYRHADCGIDDTQEFVILRNTPGNLASHVIRCSLTFNKQSNSESNHIFYYPSLGLLEVLAQGLDERVMLATSFYETLVSDSSKNVIQTIRNKFDHLYDKNALDIGDAHGLRAKVTELSLEYQGAIQTFKISEDDPYDIFSFIRAMLGGRRYDECKVTSMVLSCNKADRMGNFIHGAEIEIHDSCSHKIRALDIVDRANCIKMLVLWGVVIVG